MLTQEVFDVILGERRYQDSLDESRTDGHTHTVGEFIKMARYYLNEAQNEWVENPGDDEALKMLRKVAGICVQCFELYGVPPR